MVKKEIGQSGSNRKLSEEQTSQISQNHNIQVGYILDNITKENVIQSSHPCQNQPCQPKCNKKIKKHKKHNPDDRFLPHHIKQYYLFPFFYSTLHPFLNISWKQWKPCSVYKQMAHFLSIFPGQPRKTSLQCKSYDQRMKDYYFNKPSQLQKKDLAQSSLSNLEKEYLEKEDVEVLSNFLQKMKEKSQYIKFLEETKLEVEEQAEEKDLIYEQKRQESTVALNSKETELIFNEFFDHQEQARRGI